MTTTTTTALRPRFTACPYDVTFKADFGTKEEAQEFAAQFPKSVKMRATTCSGSDSYGTIIPEGATMTHEAHEYMGRMLPAGYVWGMVWWDAKISADGVNGGRNETGIKRYKALVKHLDRLGVAYTYEMPYKNSLTAEELAEATK